MKKIILICGMLFCVASWLCGAAVPGQAAPEFSSKDLEGNTRQLKDFKGKIVVLEAYNLDCPYVGNHYKTGGMQALQEWAIGKGAVWLVVNSVHKGHSSYRTPAQAKQEFARQKMKATAWLDDSSGAVGKAYGLKTTPHLVVIDSKGAVAYIGAVDNRPEASGDPRQAQNYVREAIEALLAGRSVSVKSTKPYGCGVKYRN